MLNTLSRKVTIITNIPSPYRVLQFDKLASIIDGKLSVIYYQKTESNRSWSIPTLSHNHFFLKQGYFSKYNFHPDIFNRLSKEKPTIIIAAGFTLTIIFTFIYARFKRVKFVVFTDSWLHSANKLKLYHRVIRRILIPKADALICVGEKGKDYLVEYGAKQNSIFISPLAINNSYYQKFYQSFKDREYDIIFSGQFTSRKMPFFVIDILKELKKRNINLSLLLIGSGPLEKKIINELEEYKISYSYPGFIQQEDLPRYYANAKLLLFPTEDDPWGLVANESCAVGTPVITCNNSGVAGDLIIHDYNGFVLPLTVDIWVEHVLRLLADSKLYETFSKNSIKHVQKYSIENAAGGIKNAINYLCEYEKNRK